MSGPESWWERAQKAWQHWRWRVMAWVPAPDFAEQLGATDPLQRWRAVRALRTRPKPDLLPALLALMDDDDPMVRAAVVDTLAAWPADSILPHVRQALGQDPSPRAAAALLELLARHPQPENRAAIQPWLDHAQQQVRAMAWMALAAIAEENDIAALEQAWEQEPVQVQRAILTALRIPQARAIYQKARASSDPILRQLAQKAETGDTSDGAPKRKKMPRGQVGGP